MVPDRGRRYGCGAARKTCGVADVLVENAAYPPPPAEPKSPPSGLFCASAEISVVLAEQGAAGGMHALVT